MTPSQPTLESIRKSPKLAKKPVGVADFVSAEELEDFREVVAEGKKTKKMFDSVDALCAEILARFGLEVYERWNAGDEEFSTEKMARFINAERARDKARLLTLENLIVAGSTVSIAKKPKQAVRAMEKALKAEEKIARGEA